MKKNKYFKVVLLQLFQILLALNAYSQLDYLRISVVPQENILKICEPINLHVNIKNEGKNILFINNPDPLAGGIRFEVFHNQELQPQVQWLNVDTLHVIEMKPMDTINIQFDLTRIFPSLFEEGKYIVVAKYFPEIEREFQIESDTTKFIIEPLSEEDLIALFDYKKFMRSSIKGKYKYGTEFLKSHSNSSFIKNVYRTMAISLRIDGKHEEAINYFNNALSTKIKIADWEKQELLYELAWTHYLKGDIQNAIKIMEQLDDKNPDKVKYVKKWSEELKGKN